MAHDVEIQVLFRPSNQPRDHCNHLFLRIAVGCVYPHFALSRRDLICALPQVKSASFILLQGVPPTISLDEVRASILRVKGVLSVHELHIWQLSESKIVASVHVMASRDHDFMPVAVEIRKVLHHHGIHSSTIQPEYHTPSPHVIPDDQLKVRKPAGSVKTKVTDCLVR